MCGKQAHRFAAEIAMKGSQRFLVDFNRPVVTPVNFILQAGAPASSLNSLSDEQKAALAAAVASQLGINLAPPVAGSLQVCLA